MPYIKDDDRIKYYKHFRDFPEIKTKGELEYLIFRMMMLYMKGKENRYSILHDCTYSAMHCADEFRRRFLDKRENEARQENGDIHNIVI